MKCNTCRVAAGKIRKQIQKNTDYNSETRMCNVCKETKSKESFTKKGIICQDCIKRDRQQRLQEHYDQRTICECGGSFTHPVSKDRHDHSEMHKIYVKYGIAKKDYPRFYNINSRICLFEGSNKDDPFNKEKARAYILSGR